MKPPPLQWNTLSGGERGPDVANEHPTALHSTGSQLAGARWDGRNEARVGASRGGRPDERRLRGLGYSLYGVGTITVLNSLTEREPDLRLGEQQVGGVGYHVISSGTFISEPQGGEPRAPEGPVMRQGQLDSPGVGRGHRRGAVGVLADGSIRIARTGGANGVCNSQVLHALFGSPGVELLDLCGGGALLIERGTHVTAHDLREVQRFESGTGGFGAPELRVGMHLAFGICDATCWLVVAHSHSGEAMQADLHAAGFGSLVVFDGGLGGFLRDSSGTPYNGRDVQGFGIRLRS